MLAVMMMRVTIIIGIISVPYCTSCGGKSMPTEAIANVNIWNGIVCLGKDCESGKVVKPIESGGRRVCWRQTSKDCGCPAPHLDGISCSPWLQRSRRVNTLCALFLAQGCSEGVTSSSSIARMLRNGASISRTFSCPVGRSAARRR